MDFTLTGWPSTAPPELKPFFNRRFEITIETGCLMWGIRVIVPSKLRERVLKELHTGHPGIVKMKSLARTLVWWPGIDEALESFVQSCYSCQSLRNKTAPTPLHPWSWPSNPWHRVHVDFAGPFMGQHFLIMVDAHSKWPEVIPMTVTTAERTVIEMRKTFAVHGLPCQIVSDNGPQFTSYHFTDFLKQNGIKHIRSAPYHPATNGEAERFVQTFKNAMKAAKYDSGTIETKLARFLLAYRNTPNSTTGQSPAELLFHRTLRTRLSLLKPSMYNTVMQSQAAQKEQHDKKGRERQFEVNQQVLIENQKKNPKWISGVVVEKLGPLSYKVKVGNEIWRRHIDQLLATSKHSAGSTDDSFEVWPNFPDTRSDDTSTTVSSEHCRTNAEPRYPQRDRHPPVRYDPSGL